MEEYLLNKTGIYIAYPTSTTLKSIYKSKNYKTIVNDQHTKIGIAKESFNSRSKGYYSNFDNEVRFIPLAIIDSRQLAIIEQVLLMKIKKEFSKVGHAKEWFNTTNRKRIIEIVFDTIITSNIKYELCRLTNHST